MKDIMGLLKQEQQLQARLAEAQEQLAAMEIVGQSGAGLVKVTLDGKGGLRRVAIDPSLMKPEETEILEDLILAAAEDARGRVEAAVAEKMQAVTGGLPLPPGLKLF